MTSLHTPPPPKEPLDKLIADALRREIGRIIVEETELAVKEAEERVRQRVRENTGALACRVLDHFSMERLGRDLIIRVDFEGLEKQAAPCMIFGVSTGTPDDDLAAAFEVGCPKVSKRIESLYWLQDEGFRTFGMICPSLPQRDYKGFAQEMFEALRTHRNEHTWAEVINLRGGNVERTTAALRAAGYAWEAGELEHVALERDAWEAQARETFIAHADRMTLAGQYDAEDRPRLRFLQYVTPKTRAWWESEHSAGAVVL